jgi:hypothetical protein
MLRLRAITTMFGLALASTSALAWETSVKDLGFKERSAFAVAEGRSGVVLAGCERNTDVAFLRLPLQEKVPVGFKHMSVVFDISIDDGEAETLPGATGQSVTGHFLLTAELFPEAAGEIYGLIAKAKRTIAIRVRKETTTLTSVQISASGSKAAMMRIAEVCNVDKAEMAKAAGQKDGDVGPVAAKLKGQK